MVVYLATATTWSPSGLTPAYATHNWEHIAPADFNGNCTIDLFDEQDIARRWGTSWGDPLHDTRYDLEPFIRTGEIDWDIDIKDVQFVFGRDGFSCLRYWDPEDTMGMYSYAADTPTGPGSYYCDPLPIIGMPTPPSSEYFVDPIGIVFTENATPSRLGEELPEHGLPVLEHDDEQRFWELGRCSFEDVDAGENEGGCDPDPPGPFCPFVDVWERMHARCEAADATPGEWFEPHVSWGDFSVCTPHFDDDENTCGHFVPEIYPYPERIYPGFEGSGFDAGREWLRQQFGVPYVIEYWGNRTPIHQRCGDDQDPASDGIVIFKTIS